MTVKFQGIACLFYFLILFIWILGFSRFVPPQTSSGNRFMPQQNSPVPSPYAPQSPAGYMPYSHPSSYTTHPQMQQGKKVRCLFKGNTCYFKQIHLFLYFLKQKLNYTIYLPINIILKIWLYIIFKICVIFIIWKFIWKIKGSVSF